MDMQSSSSPFPNGGEVNSDTESQEKSLDVNDNLTGDDNMAGGDKQTDDDTKSDNENRADNDNQAGGDNEEALTAIKQATQAEQIPKKITPLDIINELLHKQNKYFQAFDRYTSTINFEKLEDKWDMEFELKKAEHRWKTMEDIHCDLDGIAGEEYQNTFEKYKLAYAKIRETLRQKLLEYAERRYPINLEYELPSFSGDFVKYPIFKALFSRIDKHPDISDKLKMVYLMMALKGDALLHIQYIELGEGEKYQKCWDILNSIYGDKNILSRHYLKMLFEIPSMQEQALEPIKNILYTSWTVISGLKSADIDISTWDPILIYILTNKLDPQTRQDYCIATCQKYKYDELPKLDDLLDYLKRVIDILQWHNDRKEANDNNHQNQHQKKTYRKHNPRFNRYQ